MVDKMKPEYPSRSADSILPGQLDRQRLKRFRQSSRRLMIAAPGVHVFDGHAVDSAHPFIGYHSNLSASQIV